MTARRFPVWFNALDNKRYKKLKIKTPFHQKVKDLFNSFLEKQEATL